MMRLIVRAAMVRLMAALLGLLLLLLAVGWPRPAAAAPLEQQAPAVQCLRTETPPPPPDGGAVIAGPLDPNSSEPNVIVIPGYTNALAGWHSGDCGPNAAGIMSKPTSIAVTSPAHNNALNGALLFEDGLIMSAWGAVNVDSADPPPVVFPGRPDFTPNSVMVWWGNSPYAGPTGDNHPDLPEFVGDNQSCRGCVLVGLDLYLMVNPLSPPPRPYDSYAYVGNFSGATLRRSSIHPEDKVTLSPYSGPVSLVGWDFSNADLSEVNGLQGADLTRTNLSGASLINTNLQNAKLIDTILTGAVLTRVNLQGATLTGAKLRGVEGLQGADLSGYNLSGADLTSTDLRGANLSGANLSGAILTDANLQGADLTGAQLNQTIVSGTVFDYTNLAAAQLVGLQFETPPSFSQVDVGQFNGNCTTFKDTDLRNAHLTLASTTAGCETSPLLPGSTVSLGLLLSLRYYIGGAPGAPGQRVIANVNVNQARFVAEASNRSSLAGLDLSNMNLSGAQFIGWPLDLSGTRLDGANLAAVTLDGAELSGATFHNVNAAGASFQGARLAARGNLGGASLEGARLATGGNLAAADFSGSNTNLQKADFVDADVSGAKFGSADISGAVFDRALAFGTDFTGVRAKQTSFAGAHIYGDGEAFDNATDLSGADFSEAVLAGDVSQDGGFNLTRTNLTGAHFDYAQCIGCNFTGSNLDQATFTHAYLIGAVFATVTIQDTNLYNAWLYCGDVDNSSCASVPNSPGRWTWPLALGSGEVYGPVPFGTTDVTGLAQKPVKICPDGTPGANDPGCAFRLLPDPADEPPIPAACSAVAYDACPAGTTTVFDATDVQGKLLSVAPMTPPVWATALGDRAGYAIGLDDGTLRHVGGGSAQILAGRTGNRCPGSTQTCGDGGPASQAQLGSPAGLAIGLDGSLYIADPALHRVRKIDPSGNISTVAGTGQQCTAPAPTACGNGGPASAAQLVGPYGVWIDPFDRLVIADGRGGLRQLAREGVLSALPGTAAYDVRSVVGDATGSLYAAAHSPADYIIQVAPASGQVSAVVGTGTSGYNSNTDPNTGLLLSGTSVQINAPGGLSVDLSGNILFVDTANNLVRAYVPNSGFVIDDLGGMVTDNGATQGGFNGDCRWANQTELASPISVSATSGAWIIVADAGNARLRMLSPSPLNTKAVPICPSQSDAAAMLSHGRGARRVKTTTPTSVALPVRTPVATHTAPPVRQNTPTPRPATAPNTKPANPSATPSATPARPVAKP